LLGFLGFVFGFSSACFLCGVFSIRRNASSRLRSSDLEDVMPQPVSKVLPNALLVFGNVGDYPLQRHPDLALLAMETIASWAKVESFMLNLYVEMLGGYDDKAAAVYLALDTQRAKTAAINAVAARVLSPENQRLLAAILKLVRSNQKSRDRIAHWIWGDSPNIPDALLADPIEHVSGRFNPDRIFVYKKPDFDSVIRANERVAGFGMTFQFIVRGHVANQNNRLYDELCSEPEIREILNRL
jgi:hypothetical protein